MKYLILILFSTVAFADSAPTVIEMPKAKFTESNDTTASMTQQARMVPNIAPGSHGKVEGFRFVTLEPGSIYNKLGLKPMDVVKKIDDVALNSPAEAMELYNKLKSGEYSTISIIRDGKPVVLHFK